MAQAQLPGQQAQRSFADKLEKFRGTLSPDEQRILDGMLAATGPQQSGDVEGHGWVWVPGEPGWHREWFQGPYGGWHWRWVP